MQPQPLQSYLFLCLRNDSFFKKITNVSEDVKTLEPLCTVCGHVK